MASQKTQKKPKNNTNQSEICGVFSTVRLGNEFIDLRGNMLMLWVRAASHQ